VPSAPTESLFAVLDATTPLPTSAVVRKVRSALLATTVPAPAAAAPSVPTATVRAPRLLAVLLPLLSNLDLPFLEAVSL
jgi:hypothetical protein